MISAELLVAKEDFKFSCAHFIAHADGRERLHGHNYRSNVRVVGALDTAGDGYIVDFGVVKRAMRAVCAELDERFLLPTCNPHLSVHWETGGGRLSAPEAKSVPEGSTTVTIIAACDGGRFQMPTTDVIALPVPNITVEALAGVLARRFVRHPAIVPHVGRGIARFSVGVMETPGQEAILTFDAAELLRQEQVEAARPEAAVVPAVAPAAALVAAAAAGGAGAAGDGKGDDGPGRARTN